MKNFEHECNGKVTDTPLEARLKCEECNCHEEEVAEPSCECPCHNN